MERLLSRLGGIEKSINYLRDKIGRLTDWTKWAEQRIRELGGAGTTLAGGGSNPDDIANQIHATACVTTAITKATTSGTPGTDTWTITPGVGGGMRFTTFDATVPALTALTGVEEPIYSIWKDNGVATGWNVQLIKKQGVWWLDDVDSCAGLTP
jgi:hypothetical protein